MNRVKNACQTQTQYFRLKRNTTSSSLASVVFTLFSVQHLIALLTSLQRHLHRNIRGKVVSLRINSVYLNVRSLHFLDQVLGRHPTISKYCVKYARKAVEYSEGFQKLYVLKTFANDLFDLSHSIAYQLERNPASVAVVQTSQVRARIITVTFQHCTSYCISPLLVLSINPP